MTFTCNNKECPINDICKRYNPNDNSAITIIWKKVPGEDVRFCNKHILKKSLPIRNDNQQHR